MLVCSVSSLPLYSTYILSKHYIISIFGLICFISPQYSNFSGYSTGVLHWAVVLAFCLEKPCLPVVSLHSRVSQLISRLMRIVQLLMCDVNNSLNQL